MQKNIFGYLFLISITISSQTIDLKNKAINMNVLVEQIAYSKSDIKPQFIEGKFYYLNSNSKDKAFDNNFDEAYPFVNNCALVKKDGYYGIISKEGKYIIPPKYQNVDIPEYEKHIIILDDIAFNMLTGKEYLDGLTICEEPAEPDLLPFKKKSKYGVKNYSNAVILKAIYDTILDIDFNFIVAKSKNKIGVVNLKNEEIIPFRYDSLTISRGMYYSSPQTIGLKKKNEWCYFKIDGTENTKITTSPHKCDIIHDISLKNTVGIFKQKKQFNVLFDTGKISHFYYDWISYNAKIGIRDSKVYFINEDGTNSFYF